MISNEQWKEIEDRLSGGLFARQKFRYKESLVTVEKRRISENRFGLGVFIDGQIEWKWIFSDERPEVVELFWRKRSRSIYKPKEKERLIKGFGKRRAKEMFPKLDEKREWYDPLFSTAKSLVRQFKKIDGLTLVDNDQNPGY